MNKGEYQCNDTGHVSWLDCCFWDTKNICGSFGMELWNFKNGHSIHVKETEKYFFIKFMLYYVVMKNYKTKTFFL